MRRDIFLPALAVAGGGLGFLLRMWQLETAVDPITQLFYPMAPATLGLTALTVMMALAFALCCRTKDCPADYATAFHAPSTLLLTLNTTGGLLLLAAAALCMLEGAAQLYLWRLSPDRILFPAVLLLTAVLCVPAGIAALVLSKGNYRLRLPRIFPILTTFPAYASLGWLIFVYQQHSRDPVLPRYAWSLISAVCVTVGLYLCSAYAYRRRKPKLCLFTSLMGVYLNVLSLADRPAPAAMALMGAFTLLLLGSSSALLRSCFGPIWPRRLLMKRMPQGDRTDAPDVGSGPACN